MNNPWYYKDSPEYSDTIKKIEKIKEIGESHFADGVSNYIATYNRVSKLQRDKILEILRTFSRRGSDFDVCNDEDEFAGHSPW